MKSIAYIFILVALFFMGSMLSAYACSVKITVVNNGNIERGVKITGPYLRMSDTHNIKRGGSFTYHASGWIANCHGKYQVNVVVESLSDDLKTNCTGSADVDASGKSDSNWYVTINPPKQGANTPCGTMTVHKLS